jgi:hypothetical protein
MASLSAVCKNPSIPLVPKVKKIEKDTGKLDKTITN